MEHLTPTELNRNQYIFVTYNCELEVCLVTANRKDAIKYCRENNCQYSEYPPGTYIEEKQETPEEHSNYF